MLYRRRAEYDKRLSACNLFSEPSNSRETNIPEKDTIKIQDYHHCVKV